MAQLLRQRSYSSPESVANAVNLTNYSFVPRRALTCIRWKRTEPRNGQLKWNRNQQFILWCSRGSATRPLHYSFPVLGRLMPAPKRPTSGGLGRMNEICRAGTRRKFLPITTIWQTFKFLMNRFGVRLEMGAKGRAMYRERQKKSIRIKAAAALAKKQHNYMRSNLGLNAFCEVSHSARRTINRAC